MWTAAERSACRFEVEQKVAGGFPEVLRRVGTGENYAPPVREFAHLVPAGTVEPAPGKPFVGAHSGALTVQRLPRRTRRFLRDFPDRVIVRFASEPEAADAVPDAPGGKPHRTAAPSLQLFVDEFADRTVKNDVAMRIVKFRHFVHFHSAFPFVLFRIVPGTFHAGSSGPCRRDGGPVAFGMFRLFGCSVAAASPPWREGAEIAVRFPSAGIPKFR